MSSITCPKCGEAFNLDDAAYAQIAQQVRNDEFDKAVADRLALAEQQHRSEVALVVKEATSTLDQEKATVAAELDALRKELAASKKAAASQHALELKSVEAEKKAELQRLLAEKDAEVQKLEADKASELQRLRAELAARETEEQLAITQAVAVLEKDRDEAKAALERARYEKELSEKSLKESHDIQVRELGEQLKQAREYKARLSTKMVGETLEQHCEIEFNKLRATAFPNAYFEKDNDASSGTKGDFVFRDSTADGTEIVSIMFEMKNENDTTATKHRNEDFFAKLDKDR